MITKTQYALVHQWARRNIEADKCVSCSVTSQKSRLERSNISGKYKRDLSDWRILCVKCHRIADGNAQKVSEFAAKRTACPNGHAYGEFGYRLYNTRNGKIRRCNECARLCKARSLDKEALKRGFDRSLYPKRTKYKLPIGVQFHKGTGLYFTRPTINGVRFFKGYFKTIEEAQLAYWAFVKE